MKRLVIAAVVAAMLALSPAAASAGVPHGTFRGKITKGFLKGTWTMTFYRHGTRYKVKSRFGTTVGRTRFRGSTVIFDREKDLDAVCHKKAGKYRWRLSRGVLTMRAIREPCRERKKVNTVRYRKVS